MFNFIKRLKRYRLNKEHLKLVWEAWKGYPFDHGYLLNLEELKLKEMLVYHKYRSVVPLCDEQREEIIRSLELACKLIHILNNETDLFHFESNKSTEEMFVKSDIKIDGEECYEMNPKYKQQYFCDVNVNLKNVHRFCTKEQIPYYTRMPHEVYLLKVKHLYHLIRERYDELWWD